MSKKATFHIFKGTEPTDSDARRFLKAYTNTRGLFILDESSLIDPNEICQQLAKRKNKGAQR